MTNLIKGLLLNIIMVSCLINYFINIKILDHEYERKLKISIISDDFAKKELEIVQGTTFCDVLTEIGLNKDTYVGIYGLDEPLYDGEVLFLKNIINTSLISINNSNLEELCTLPGIGEKTALKIIEYRITYQSFKYLAELKNVSGIGDKKFEKLKEYICL